MKESKERLLVGFVLDAPDTQGMGDAETSKFIPPVPGPEPAVPSHLLCGKQTEKLCQPSAGTEHPPANESC